MKGFEVCMPGNVTWGWYRTLWWTKVANWQCKKLSFPSAVSHSMQRLTNTKLSDFHLTLGAANGNKRTTQKLYRHSRTCKRIVLNLTKDVFLLNYFFRAKPAQVKSAGIRKLVFEKLFMHLAEIFKIQHFYVKKSLPAQSLRKYPFPSLFHTSDEYLLT